MEATCTDYRKSQCGNRRGIDLAHQSGDVLEFCSWHWTIDNLKFTPYNVRGDGNCLMYCAQMAGVEDPVNEIRLKVAHVLRTEGREESHCQTVFDARKLLEIKECY
jgi:hypothetical protein